MAIDLSLKLKRALENDCLPSVTAYNRIDGPGSSLDLREFQQALWHLPKMPCNAHEDPSMEWTRNLPRTVGISIDIGTKITAFPFDNDYISVKSTEYGTEVKSRFGEVTPTKENWILKMIEIFNISGVKFILKNLHTGTQSAGLGGSASAFTGACILANELAGRPFSGVQLISMVSRLEQDLGVSITGTQEQSNVIFGGVTDYIWFPWGIPGQHETGYGESIRCELLRPDDYHQLEQRIAIFHTGKPRNSTDVNTIWREKLVTKEGYKSHYKKLAIAYQFREALRLHQWDQVKKAIDKYREIRTNLCSQYMDGSMEILGRAEPECTAFPLGAGGGGGVLLFSPEPQALQKLKEDLLIVYREIPFRICQCGHVIENLNYFTLE